ncbi:hypothetical protein MMYC01_205488 [Madurella mycetomatis]|uniref:Uncharacterized protein n=1 Tax=Madurella mycetomatis TaxID=100816 RepID=A0A175W3Z6_9PEZI|nr:hypothetical protein MMYC01_205488 [Madurella mycetomatis]
MGACFSSMNCCCCTKAENPEQTTDGQQRESRITDGQQTGTQPTRPGEMDPKMAEGGTGSQPTTPQRGTEEVRDIIIRKTSDIKPIEHISLEAVEATKETAEISHKFFSFRYWLMDGPPYPPKVHLHTIEQRTGMGARWALLNVGSQNDALYLHRFLSSRRNAPKYQKELSLCYLLDKPIFMTLKPSDTLSGAHKPDSSTASAIATLGSLCGQLAEFRTNSSSPVVATIGGLVKLKGRLWVVAAKHATPRSEDAAEMPAAPGTDPDIDPREYDTETIQPLHVIWPKNREEMPMRATSIPFEFEEEINTNLECRLIPVDNPDLILPNRFRLEPSSPYKNVEGVEPEPRAGKVAVLAGVSGCHFMRMLPEEARLCLPSGKWETVWALEPEEKGGLVMVQPGDSGSWVVDPEQGSVFGIVIASTTYTVYLVPLKDMLRRATDQGLQEDWSLPSPEDVETARDAARKALGLDDATKAARDALADNYKLEEKLSGRDPATGGAAGSPLVSVPAVMSGRISQVVPG